MRRALAEMQLAAAKDSAAPAKAPGRCEARDTFVAEKHPEHELAAEAEKHLAALSKL